MMNSHTHFSTKIVNPDLARMAMNKAEPHGEFHVIVRLVRPGQVPRYMKATGLHSPGNIKARIPCNQIRHINDDSNVVSIELREHVIK